MLGKIRLYKLKLNPKDNLYFSTREEQNAFFDTKVSLEINNVSYNMSREIRINGNAFKDITSYSYCVYEFEDKKLYFFINNINWVNDNSISLGVLLDIYQTFCIEDFEYSSGILDTRTLPSAVFKKYLPFSNKYPINDFDLISTFDLGNKISFYNLFGELCDGYLCYIVISIDDSINDLTTSKFSPKMTTYRENGYNYSYVNLIIPTLYNSKYKCFERISLIHSTNDIIYLDLYDVENILNEYGSYIKNVSLVGNCFIKQSTFISTTDGCYLTIDNIGRDEYTFVNYKLSSTITRRVINYWSHSTPMEKSINLASYNINDNELYNPYLKINMGSYNNNSDINLIDFIDNSAITDKTLKIEYFTSLNYPCSTTCNITFSGKGFKDFNLVYTFNNECALPYDIDAWKNYYSLHSASVNDGLSTKHYYDKAINQEKINNAIVDTTLDYTSGVVTGAVNILGRDVLRGFGGVIGTNAGLVKNVTDIATMSNINKLTLNQEKALLNIKWNDIKSAPDQSMNINSNITSKLFVRCPITYITLYQPSNIADVRKFHNIFGYEINRSALSLGSVDLTKINVQTHTKFDFIKYKNFNVLNPMPFEIREDIVNLFENGIRLWWTYDENFGDISSGNQLLSTPVVR